MPLTATCALSDIPQDSQLLKVHSLPDKGGVPFQEVVWGLRYVLRIPGGDSALLLQEKQQLEGLSAQTSSASGAVISGLFFFFFWAPPSLSPCPLQGLGNMRSAAVMIVCLLALATPIGGSRRRLHAVHRQDDLGVSDSNSSAGEIIAGGWLTGDQSSEPGEKLTGPADDAATSTVVPEPAPIARELATETTQVPAASSSDGCQRSGNEAPLEIIRLEDGTVLVERRGNFMGPPPPTPVNQPVAPVTTAHGLWWL